MAGIAIAHMELRQSLQGRLSLGRAVRVWLIVLGFWAALAAALLAIGQPLAGSNTELKLTLRHSLQALPNIAIPLAITMTMFVALRARRVAKLDLHAKTERIVLAAGLACTTVMALASPAPGRVVFAVFAACVPAIIVSLARLNEPGPIPEERLPSEGVPVPAGPGASAAGSAPAAPPTPEQEPAAPPTPEQEPAALPTPEQESIEEVLRELREDFIGLEPVKEEIEGLIAQVKIDTERRDAGLSSKVIPPNLSFEGPPGTGKTTVAKIYARALHAQGVLERGHLVEASRAKLIGKYQGHTAQLTNEMLEKARGGALCIDEAYALVKGDDDTFGHECIDALVEGMDRLRGQVVVILLGYPDQMKQLYDANPGLRSRVPHTVHFPDYSDEELHEIGRLEVRKRERELTAEADERLGEVLVELHAETDPQHWGNAREVRNLCDALERAQAQRLAALGERLTQMPLEAKREQLRLLLPDDIDAAAERYRTARSGSDGQADGASGSPGAGLEAAQKLLN